MVDPRLQRSMLPNEPHAVNEEARTSAQQAKEALLKGNSEDAARWRTRAYPCPDGTDSLIRCRGTSPSSAVAGTGRSRRATAIRCRPGLTRMYWQPSAQVAGRSRRTDCSTATGRRASAARLRPRLDEYQRQRHDSMPGRQCHLRPKFLSAIRALARNSRPQTSDILRGYSRMRPSPRRLAPAMMGPTPRTYFMGFQTTPKPAHRGLLGGFGVLRFDNGTPSWRPGSKHRTRQSFTPSTCPAKRAIRVPESHH